MGLIALYIIIVFLVYFGTEDTPTIESEVVGHDDDPHYVCGDCENWE